MGKSLEMAAVAPKTSTRRLLKNVMIVKLLQSIFKLYYRLLSPLLGNRCRFAPSCSEYAHQALERHGLVKGLWLTIKRLCRCHPWGGDGFDPVPEVSDDTPKNLE